MKFWELTVFCLLTMIFGILGFYISINLLTPTDESPTFFEIRFDKSKKGKVETLLSNRITKLNILIPYLKSKLDSLKPTTPVAKSEDELKKQILAAQNASDVEDTNKIKRDYLKAKLEIAELTLSQSTKDLNELLYYNKDTSIEYYADYIRTDNYQLFESLSDNSLRSEAKRDTLKFYLIDTSLVSIGENSNIVKDTLRAEISDPKSKVAFINQYPIFGFWLVLSIGQLTIWFIIAMVVIGTTMKAVLKANET